MGRGHHRRGGRGRGDGRGVRRGRRSRCVPSRHPTRPRELLGGVSRGRGRPHPRRLPLRGDLMSLSPRPDAAPGPAPGSAPGPDGLQRMRRGLAAALLWSAVVLLALMTVLVLFQVFTRYVLGTPAAFTEELVRYALIWVSFIAATYAFLQREHMALTLVADRLPAAARRGLRLAIDVLVLALAVLVLGVGGAMLAWDSREHVSALLGISRGLVYLMSPIAGAGLGLSRVLNIIEARRSPSAPSATAPKAAEWWNPCSPPSSSSAPSRCCSPSACASRWASSSRRSPPPSCCFPGREPPT